MHRYPLLCYTLFLPSLAGAAANRRPSPSNLASLSRLHRGVGEWGGLRPDAARELSRAPESSIAPGQVLSSHRNHLCCSVSTSLRPIRGRACATRSSGVPSKRQVVHGRT
jgi:hypothetical protein